MNGKVRRRLRVFRFWPVVAAAIVPVVVLVLETISSRGSLRDRGNLPHNIQPIALQTSVTLSDDERVLLLTAATPQSDINLHDLVHALRLYNFARLEARQEVFESYQLARYCVLDDSEYQRRFAGLPLLVDTVFGAAYRTNSAKSGTVAVPHVDKLLSVYSELGWSLDTPIRTSRSVGVLADVLEDSLQRCNPARELDWSVIAYVHYLPPQTSWVNHGGNRTDFDQLADALLKRDHGAGVCFGTHTLYGLTMILRADTEVGPIVSAKTRVAIRERLQVVSAILSETQQPDGCWLANWSGRQIETRDSRLDQAIRVTGHQLEWIAFSPIDCRPPHEVVEQAVVFLKDDLFRNLGVAFSKQYSISSHAVRALLCLLPRSER